MLEVTKVCIDTRFKTPESKSHSYFIIKLPNTNKTLDDAIAYVNDMVNTIENIGVYHRTTTNIMAVF
jgi:hypothetical protein